MQSVAAKVSISAALCAAFLASRNIQAETSPGLSTSFADLAYANAPSEATTRPPVAPPPLVRAPDLSSYDLSAAPMPGNDGAIPAARRSCPIALELDKKPDNAAEPSESALTACACGCGIFDVGTSCMLPEGRGGTVYLEYDFQNQNHNWSGSSHAPAENNSDKAIRTNFLTAGLQYMVDEKWGFQLEVPYELRHFQTTGGASGNDDVSLNWGGLGDIRVKGIYTGFFPDLSAGVTFGFKIPTGDFQHNDIYGSVDRDTQLGTGSTDVLLGGFYRHGITADNLWTWFAQLNMDLPLLIQKQYRPGMEFDAAAGIYYSGLSIGKLEIAPVAQILLAERTSDTGANAADPVASGYQRILLSPGLELHFHPFTVYGDVEVPVYQYMTGNQLVAPVLFKLMVSYRF